MNPGGEGEHYARDSSAGEGWITGILTGAERFLNAVLGSDTPSSSSCSSSSASDDTLSLSFSSSHERGGNGNGNGSLAVSTTRNEDLNQIGTLERDSVMVDCLDQDIAVSEIDSKQAIEKLLQEETFSRDECNYLVDLIKSRVIRSDEQQPVTLEKEHSLPSKLGSSLLNYTRNMEFTAVNEAKKWLEAKKSPGSTPSVLNTDLEFDQQTGSSPVELARAYMNSLPQESCTKIYKRGCESAALVGMPPERTKRVKVMLIEGSALDAPKFKNSTVQSSYQAQASTELNDIPILTAIPLNPSDLHVNTVPYVTCATDVPETQPGGHVPSTDICSTPKLILHDSNHGIISPPSTSRRGRGGRTGRGRGRGRSKTANEVVENSSHGITGDDSAKESLQKSSQPRRGRGRGRGRGANKTAIVSQ